ncbi:MAG: hypothetical protein C3F13_05540 [Anaerolineales bacterium]|nr:MAG: hypothetical protein C3F13_05540 [Anaerolineales bacterium]
MKTQIIQLNQKEDTISVRDKISWAQTERVLLVWPDSGKVLNHKLDLILLKRYTASLGSQLALVTQDAEVRFYANQIGISAFDTIRQAQEQAWVVEKPGQLLAGTTAKHPDLAQMRVALKTKRAAWLEHPVTRYVCLSFCVLAVLSLVLLFLPGAKVVINPKEVVQSVKINLSADPGASTVNISTGSLPSYTFATTIEGNAVITATGSIPIPGEAAVGSLQFTNKSKKTITIPPGTIVNTFGSNPVRFTTLSPEAVQVRSNRSALIDARAIKPGSAGNLPAGSLVVIEGEKIQGLSVTNPDATHGGSNIMIPSPSLGDLDDLREQLSNQLNQAGLAQIKSQLPTGDTLLEPSLKIVETLEEVFSPEIGQPAKHLKLFLRVRLEAQVVASETLHSLVIPILEASAPPGFTAQPNTLMIEQVDSPSLDADGKIHWQVNATQMLEAEVPVGLVAESVKGLKVDLAQERLSNRLDLDESAQIILSPRWWPRLPFLAMRINVVPAGYQ